MTNKIKDIDRALVVKSNQLVEARYKLNSNEQKLIMTMISMIEPNDEDFKPYRVNVTDFAKLLGIEDDGAYKAVKLTTRSLMERVLEIEEPEGLLQISWFSSAKYFDKQGYVLLRFDPLLKPYLLQLKARFTCYQFKNVLQLNSGYSIRIYELLKQYQKIGGRNLSVEELRKILGVKDSEYKLYADFKRFVILTAQSELAKSTDLSFTFKELKTGRKVTGIEFTITVKPPEPTEATITPPTKPINVTSITPAEPPASTQPEPPPDISALVNLLPPEHKGKKTITDAITAACKEHGRDYVAYNIRYANANCKDKNKYRVYLNKALKENWGVGIAEDVEAAKTQATATQEAKKKEDTGRHDKDTYDRTVEYIAKLKPKERKKLEAEALASFTPDMQVKYKAGVSYAVTGVKKVMEGLVIERLAGRERE